MPSSFDRLWQSDNRGEMTSRMSISWNRKNYPRRMKYTPSAYTMAKTASPHPSKKKWNLHNIIGERNCGRRIAWISKLHIRLGVRCPDHTNNNAILKQAGMANIETMQIWQLTLITVRQPQVEACVPAFLRKRGNWKTPAYTGRLFVDYAALSNNRSGSDQLGTFGRQRIHVHVTGDKTQE